MSIVYVLGAGTSYGDVLHRLPDAPLREVADKKPPLANKFFSESVLRSVGYNIETIRRDYPEALDYIIRLFNIEDEHKGAERWQNIDIESVFTSIELDREFWGAESDYGAHLLQVRNKLLRCIFRIISMCTLGFWGESARSLVEGLLPMENGFTFCRRSKCPLNPHEERSARGPAARKPSAEGAI